MGSLINILYTRGFCNFFVSLVVVKSTLKYEYALTIASELRIQVSKNSKAFKKEVQVFYLFHKIVRFPIIFVDLVNVHVVILFKFARL